DGADDADGLAQRERERVVAELERLAVDLRRPAGEIAEDLGGERDLDLARIEERLARAQALELRHLVEVLLDQIAQLPHEAAALVGAHARPRALVKGLAGRGDRRVDVALVALGHRRDRLFVGGIDGRVGLAGQRRLPLAVDEDLSGRHGYLLSRALSRSATASPGRSERWGLWGHLGAPISLVSRPEDTPGSRRGEPAAVHHRGAVDDHV